MKRYIKQALLLLLGAPMLTSCLQEFMPTDNAIQEQVNKADKTSLAKAIPAYLNQYSSDEYYDIGFAGFFIWRDASTADLPIADPAYDYFTYVETCTWLGSNWQLQYTIWRRYYALIQKTNLVLEAVNPEEYPDDTDPAIQAYAYRANAYMELAQWYEYKHTGYAAFDDKAQADGIMGLTVPIVTENTSEMDSRNNPRVPFYTLYRFVQDDLTKAMNLLYGTPEPVSKTSAGRGVVNGLLARFWLTVGTRFELHPEDLTEQLKHEDDSDIPYAKLGVSSAKECFEKAATYARAAINCGYTPLSEGQWFDPITGFNSVNGAWLWANIITSDNGLASSMTWQSWVSFMSPEAEYGVAHPDYGATRMINSSLFEGIPNSDWRKATWVAPEDVASQSAYNSKYARGTNMDFTTWKRLKAYCGIKFHPANGDYATSTVGNAVSIPLMRVEEMYLIEAEAVGRAQGDGAGRQLLEAFVNGYRYTDGSYKSTGAGMEGFIDDVFTQKRIEFWGEGLILWDYRRLEKAVTRGYPGTNFTSSHRYNSLPNAVAPWTTLCIPTTEKNYNPAVILNPDPSHGTVYQLWEEE